MGDGRFTDHYVHAVTELLQHLIGVIALVVGAHAGLEVGIQLLAAAHRRAAEHWESATFGELDCREHILVHFLDKLAYCLPNTDAFRPGMGGSVVLGPEIMADM